MCTWSHGTSIQLLILKNFVSFLYVFGSFCKVTWYGLPAEMYQVLLVMSLLGNQINTLGSCKWKWGATHFMISQFSLLYIRKPLILSSTVAPIFSEKWLQTLLSRDQVTFVWSIILKLFKWIVEGKSFLTMCNTMKMMRERVDNLDLISHFRPILWCEPFGAYTHIISILSINYGTCLRKMAARLVNILLW